jgi:hypothetical protein
VKRQNSTNDNTKQTKSALVPIFGRDHVRVHHGRGTAYGWVDIKVQVPRPADCFCSELRRDADDVYSRYAKCDACRETKDLAKRLIDVATAGIKYDTWYLDDGHSTACDQTNTDITFDNEYSYAFGTNDTN